MSNSEATRSALLRASTPVPSSLFSSLIAANHILHHQGVVDTYGHISVRNPQNPSTFYLSKSLAPALVSSRADIQEYRVEDGEPVDTDSPPGYVERYIHSEIYKRYKGVNSVVHAHSEPVLPFGITTIPMRPVFHMGSTIGGQVPIYDIANHYASSDKNNLLIANVPLGASLAAAFAPTSVISKTTTMIKNYLTSSTAAQSASSTAPDFPPCPVVLMRGHGFTCVAPSIEEAVHRAVYTVTNARVQTQALLMQGSYNVGLVAEHFGSWDGARDGQGGGPRGQAKQEGLRYLTNKEVKESGTPGLQRCWGLWTAGVRAVPLYRNEVLEEMGQSTT